MCFLEQEKSQKLKVIDRPIRGLSTSSLKKRLGPRADFWITREIREI